MSTVVKMLTGFISIKVIASIIGPGGIALIGQLGNFSTILLTIASGGINNGVTKHVAEHQGLPGKVGTIITSALKITMLFSVLASVFLIFGAKFLSTAILKSEKFAFIFWIFGGTIILYALNNLILSVINGHREFRKYISINIITSITGMVFTILLVLAWNVRGALIAFVSYQSVIFFVTLAMVRKSHWFRTDVLREKIDRTVVKALLKFSLMTFVSAMMVPTAQLVIRGILSRDLSLSHAGIWEGMNRISGIYLMVITTSLSVYYLPKLSGSKSHAETRETILTLLKFVMPIMIIALAGIYLLRDLVIRVLFTGEFTLMRDLFIYQLTGDIFKIATWAIAYQMWAKGLTLLFISTEIIFNVTLVLLSVFCINRYLLEGASMAYMLNYILCFVTMVFIFRKQLFYAG